MVWLSKGAIVVFLALCEVLLDVKSIFMLFSWFLAGRGKHFFETIILFGNIFLILGWRDNSNNLPNLLSHLLGYKAVLPTLYAEHYPVWN